jgi:glycosyltransferase involved in cell wall biosynthesis
MSHHSPAAASHLISVVMPCHNAGIHLREAVQSVLKQVLPPPWRLELLLIDDGSNDAHTLSLIEQAREDRRVSVLVNTRALGVSRARNRGIAAAQGELIAFLDADDLWERHHLATHIGVLQTHAVGFSASDYTHIDEQGRCLQETSMLSHRRKGPLLRAQLGEQRCAVFQRSAPLFISACPVWIGTAVVRREALGDAPVFNESLSLAEDLELWIRLALAHDFVFSREVTAHYRQVRASATHRAGMARVDAVAATMYLGLASQPEFGSHRRLLRETAGQYLLAAAYGYKRIGRRRDSIPCLFGALGCLPFAWRAYRQLLILPLPCRAPA